MADSHFTTRRTFEITGSVTRFQIDPKEEDWSSLLSDAETLIAIGLSQVFDLAHRVGTGQADELLRDDLANLISGAAHSIELGKAALTAGHAEIISGLKVEEIA